MIKRHVNVSKGQEIQEEKKRNLLLANRNKRHKAIENKEKTVTLINRKTYKEVTYDIIQCPVCGSEPKDHTLFGFDRKDKPRHQCMVCPEATIFTLPIHEQAVLQMPNAAFGQIYEHKPKSNQQLNNKFSAKKNS
jgi:hypothetical protein